jgi:pyruvate dehydrogenase E1 component alpha subunit
LTPSEDLAKLLLIRHFETELLRLFAQGQIAGTTHTCLGQEYVPVALAPLLEDAYVFSNHRGHGHYLARYDDPEGLLAEILGREGAVCHGVGGSQHILRERYLSTGVQGQSVPVAAGVALHYRRTGQTRVAAAFIGDGTWGEGSVYEGLNMAALWGLPLVVIVENNGIAQSTPTSAQMAGSIEGRAAAFGITYHRIAGDDIASIRAELQPLLTGTRTGAGPLIVEFETTRLGPHSKGDDSRPADVLDGVRTRDWAIRYRAADQVGFDAVDAEQRQRVAGVLADVLARPASEWKR